MPRVNGKFLVIPSALKVMHQLLCEVIAYPLDGLFSLVPHWATSIVQAAQEQDGQCVDEYRNRFVRLFELVRRFGAFTNYTTIVSERDVPGNFAPAQARFPPQGATCHFKTASFSCKPTSI